MAQDEKKVQQHDIVFITGSGPQSAICGGVRPAPIVPAEPIVEKKPLTPDD